MGNLNRPGLLKKNLPSGCALPNTHLMLVCVYDNRLQNIVPALDVAISGGTVGDVSHVAPPSAQALLQVLRGECSYVLAFGPWAPPATPEIAKHVDYVFVVLTLPSPSR